RLHAIELRVAGRHGLAGARRSGRAGANRGTRARTNASTRARGRAAVECAALLVALGVLGAACVFGLARLVGLARFLGTPRIVGLLVVDLLARRFQRRVEPRDARLDLGALVGVRRLVEVRAVVLDRGLGLAELVVAEREVVVVEIGGRELLRGR